MNYTENYHLPQWKKEDRIMMDDFNAAMANLEEGITEAQTTADTLPYVVGTYTGDGATYRNIDVGFRPQFVIICTEHLSSSASYGGHSVLMTGAYPVASRLYVTDTGFRLDHSNTLNPYPMMNENGRPYDYIAFK